MHKTLVRKFRFSNTLNQRACSPRRRPFISYGTRWESLFKNHAAFCRYHFRQELYGRTFGDTVRRN